MVAAEDNGAGAGEDLSDRSLTEPQQSDGKHDDSSDRRSLQTPTSTCIVASNALRTRAALSTRAVHSSDKDRETDAEDMDYVPLVAGNKFRKGSGSRSRSPTAPTFCTETPATTRQDLVREPQRVALGHVSPGSPSHSRLPNLPSRLALSDWNRERGISLRSSILTRNVQSESSGSTMELQPTAAAAVAAAQQSPAVHGSSKKSEMNTTSPIVKTGADIELFPRTTQKPHESLALPNYERWSKNKAAHSVLLSRLRAAKERIRRKILRIQEIPPSKDGRHIGVDLIRQAPLTDERTGRAYVKNTITSSRYTLYNFIPRQLFAQFSKLANFYFLCVSILQMIPGLSTTGSYTTIVPLAFFVIISMAKEGYDDLRRYRLDKAENRKAALVLCEHKVSTAEITENASSGFATYHERWDWTEKKWENIEIGDIVKLKRNESAPADIALLYTNEIAYVETMALDGETSLKSRQALPLLARSCSDIEGIASCKAHIVVEDPNIDLYSFEGKVTVGDETLPLTNNEVIYRGSILRNTSEVIGIVVYSGQECKVRMNATKIPRIKAPALQNVVNKVVVILVIFVVILAIFNTVAYQIWQETTEEKAWYLTDASVTFFPILTSFIILFNTMIPLSLYVSLEIVKLFQILLMNDVDMYDEVSNTPMEARTSTINEELGQINYIFSDKTGTLTNNSMRFRKMSIAGTAWLHDPDVQEEVMTKAARSPALQKKRSKGKKPIRRDLSIPTSGEASASQWMSPNSSKTPFVYNHSMRRNISKTEVLLQYLQRRPCTQFARKVHFFLLSIALCHTCYPEKKENGEVEYQAASPDEQALVRAAQELGYVMIDRKNSAITIKTLPQGHGKKPTFETYHILDVIEFSSNRKRMSVIVRMPDHRLCVFCKGADSTLIRLLRLSGLAIAKAIEIEQQVSMRQSFEAQEALRRASEAKSRKDSMTRRSLSIHRPSMTASRLQPIRDEFGDRLRDREIDRDMYAAENSNAYYSPRPSAHFNSIPRLASLDDRPSFQGENDDELVEEALVVDDAAVLERCFRHVNDFATEGLRTLLYGFRYMDEGEYESWKKFYLDASTSLTNRQEMIEIAGAQVERDLELLGVTAIEDKLQIGVPEAIEKLRRAKIKLWMLTGDKRETAVNIGHSCRLIKDYSSITVLDHETGEVSQRIAALTVDINDGRVAHSVVVVDGHTLSQITSSEPLHKLFVSLAILVDTVICCRASPSQKAFLVSSIRHKDRTAITLAIGDGANDIAMIQEAHVGIGITGKEGLQAARTSDYSIAQFRFLTKLLLVHGRWNYIRTCKYTLGTFWKEMLFYLTQALYQRYAGYTGTSLYESWSLSLFNTFFTSLPVIFMGIFEQDLSASTLMAAPELYHSLGHCNGGFKIKIYLAWVAMAASQAVIVFFIMLGLFGQTIFTTDNDLYAMGALTFTASILIIATKMQFWELHNKTYLCAISILVSVGGWFLWMIILSMTYNNNVIYDVREGFLVRFGRNALWWLTLTLILATCWVMEAAVKVAQHSWFPSEANLFRELEKDLAIKKMFEQAAAVDSPTNGRADPTEVHGGLPSQRTAEEGRQRETEIQNTLDHSRHSESASGAKNGDEIVGALRRRQHSELEVEAQGHRVFFAVEAKENARDDHGSDDANGKEKPLRRSTDVHDLLRRGFGSVRRSLDIA